MPPPTCQACGGHRAEVKRPKTGQLVCRSCFFQQVEDEVHQTIVSENMFIKGDIVASGASGGKDSTVLLHLLCLLNERHKYGIDIRLVSVDEGITGYRDDSLRTVKENAATYQLPLHVLSYTDLFGWTMDDIVKAVGLKNSCTYCGVLRRQALERGAKIVQATVIATGHNADDNAETLLMNVLRADIPRLTSSSEQMLAAHPTDTSPRGSASTSAEAPGSLCGIRRVKPLKHLYQKDIVLYAHHQKLDYFTTECTYAPEAFRGTVRELIKSLEAVQPKCIANIVRSGETMFMATEPAGGRGSSHKERKTNGSPLQAAEGAGGRLRECVQCGAATNQERCRACVLLSALEGKNAAKRKYL